MNAGSAVGAVATIALSMIGTAPAAGQGIGGRAGDPPSTPLTVARLEYAPGDWYGNPTSLVNLLAFVRTEVGLETAEREAVVKATDPELSRYPLLYLTGHGEIRLTDDEVTALRAHLENGGFLHADDNFGIDPSLRRELERLFPREPLVELPVDHPIFSAAFPFPDGVPKIHEHDGGPPKAYGIFHDGRLVVFYTFNTDLGDGWEDQAVHGDPEEARTRALRMGANIFLYALTH